MEKEEKVILKHFSHKHPLTLVESRPWTRCYGCGTYFSGQEAYRCNEQNCDYRDLLHEECAEMPIHILHPMHPQHKLEQKALYMCWGRACAVCKRSIHTLAYRCDTCQLEMHLGCAAASMGVTEADEDKEKPPMRRHPSHPKHELKLLRRPGRSCSFRCDGCGTMEKGNSYVCVHKNCQLMIHENCASLHSNIRLENHHHDLYLAFHLPMEYNRFGYECDICEKALLPKYWVYHCADCRYVIHIKCAVETSLAATSDSTNINAVADVPSKDDAVDDEDVIKFPVNDVSEQLIKRFVIREGKVIPPEVELIINGKYKFHSHHHQLTLISSEGRDNDDDDDYDDCPHSELICDACITPIYQSSSSSSSSSSHKQYFYYMSCDECKYFLHLACFYLPHELHSHMHPLHNEHPLILQTSHKLETITCSVCHLYTNRLFYACKERECDFKVDIKCAALPKTLKHIADSKHRFHPQLNREEYGHSVFFWCDACGGDIDTNDISYRCDYGEYDLHCKCVLLPASSKHRWEKHPLLMTDDASKDHPTEFYCAICEEEMNPRRWMYHCSKCDQSFHPECIPTARGEYKNIKFGQQYTISTCHDPIHPLTYQLITTRQSCDLCDEVVQGYRGFQCASCNFVMCFDTCGEKNKAAIKEINNKDANKKINN